jgi:hypothetical protein
MSAPAKSGQHEYQAHLFNVSISSLLRDVFDLESVHVNQQVIDTHV